MASKTALVVRSNRDSKDCNTLKARAFFELAIPVFPADSEDGEAEAYPPPGGRVTLRSKGGYERSYAISEGVCTDDGYCSFRFYDVSAPKYQNDVFTAELQWEGGKQVLFKEQKLLGFVQAARKQGDYEPAFVPGPEGFLEEPAIAEGEDETAPDSEADEETLDETTLAVEDDEAIADAEFESKIVEESSEAPEDEGVI
ncbi:MAG: hypothetical protein AB1714_01935 [Acidobacteriota bacterium]